MTDTTKPKLKTCPFCGSRAHYVRIECSEEVGEQRVLTTLWSVACGIGCATSPEIETADQAAGWWNRRPEGGS